MFPQLNNSLSQKYLSMPNQKVSSYQHEFTQRRQSHLKTNNLPNLSLVQIQNVSDASNLLQVSNQLTQQYRNDLPPSETKGMQTLKIMDERIKNGFKKKDFKLQINSSIALLKQDYDKIISLAKHVQEKEEMDSQLKNNPFGVSNSAKKDYSSLNTQQKQYDLAIKPKNLQKSQSQATIVRAGTKLQKNPKILKKSDTSQFLSIDNNNESDEDFLENHDVSSLNLNLKNSMQNYPNLKSIRKIGSETYSLNAFDPQNTSILSPLHLRYLNIAVSRDAKSFKQQGQIESQKNMQSYISRLLKEKKDKLKNIFENSDKSKGMFSFNKLEGKVNFSQQSKKSVRKTYDNRSSIQIDEIKEEMNDDDVKQGMNFHYQANINVKNDKMDLVKLSNDDRNYGQEMSLNQSYESLNSSALDNYKSNTNRLIYESQKNMFTRNEVYPKLSPREIKKNFEPNQMVQSYNLLQQPIYLQNFKLKGLDMSALQKFMKVFERTLNPQYTGSVDLNINKFSSIEADAFFTWKLQNRHKENFQELLERKFPMYDKQQMALLNELEQIEQKLKCGEIIKGFAREPFNDTRTIIDYDEKYSCQIFENKGEEGIDYPQKRFGHSLSVFKQNLVLFGGGGAYNSQAKTRLSLNDVKTFNTVTKKWDTDDFVPFERDGVLLDAPKRRMHHAADVYGCILTIHGGFSAELKQVLGDFALYDLKMKSWIKTEITKQTKKITARYMHTMTAVYSHTADENAKFCRGLWAQEYQPKGSDKESQIFEPNLMGLYIFGGLANKQDFLDEEDNSRQNDDSSNQNANSKTQMGGNNKLTYSNELWFVKPDYIENQKRLKLSKKSANSKDKDYDYKNQKKAPTLCLEVIKLNPSGKQPAPRCLHSASFFSKQYIAYFGGKNDNYYQDIKNIALNDLFMYDIKSNCWIIIANYGCYPEGRFSHGMVSTTDFAGTGKLIIFGGQNMKVYCPAMIYQFDQNDLNIELKARVYKQRIEDVQYEAKKHNYIL
eukprot:403373153